MKPAELGRPSAKLSVLLRTEKSGRTAGVAERAAVWTEARFSTISKYVAPQRQASSGQKEVATKSMTDEVSAEGSGKMLGAENEVNVQVPTIANVKVSRDKK